MTTQPRFYWLLALIFIFFCPSHAWTQNGKPIEVKPSERTVNASLPFKVVVAKLDAKDGGLRLVSIVGIRARGTSVVASILIVGKDGPMLTTRAFIEERVNQDADKPISWDIAVWTEQTSDEMTFVDIYIKPEGVPYDGGQGYRIALNDWIVGDKAK